MLVSNLQIAQICHSGHDILIDNIFDTHGTKMKNLDICIMIKITHYMNCWIWYFVYLISKINYLHSQGGEKE